MKNSKTFKVLQITDTHLFSKPGKMFDVDCNSHFIRVLEAIKQNEKDVDFIFATGDISQDETLASYDFFRNNLEQLKAPVYWIPGNHDDPIKMQAALQKSSYFIRASKLEKESWNFIFLDTKIEGKDAGFISESKLADFEALLKQGNNLKKHIAVVMHHHPLPVNTPLVDNYILENRTAFLSIIKKHESVRLVICGHVHGDYTVTYGNFTLEASPATSVQWEKGTSNLTTDARVGYKVYQFNANGYLAEAKLWELDN